MLGSLIVLQECGACAFDTFYFYEDGAGDRLRNEFTSSPGRCVLAAIRNADALRGAQSAIPRGKVALTQGYAPFDDLVKYCDYGSLGFSTSEKTDNCTINSCSGYGYYEFFRNWEGSRVEENPFCWKNVTFPIPCKKTHVALGSDGALRPVTQLNEDNEWDGAVYECCPQITNFCNEQPPVEATRKLRTFP